MNPTTSGSYLDICKCGKHGCIVHSDRSESCEFASKEKGFLAIRFLFREGIISDEESAAFAKTLATSSLVERESEVGDLIKIKTAILNFDFEHITAIKVCGYVVDPEAFNRMFSGCERKQENHLFYEQPKQVM